MKIEDYFKHIYYINLDKRTDRREEFEKEMDLVGIKNYERVPGIQVENLYGVDGFSLGRLRHTACGTVHKNLIQKAKDNNFESVLIFEDDACFYNEGKESGIEIIEKALDFLSVNSDWDLFYLSGLVIDDNLELVSDNVVKVNTVLTTHAYAINKRAYDHILKYNPSDDCAIDGWYGQQADESGIIGSKFKKYVVYPLAMRQRDSLSDCDIDSDGNPTMGHGIHVYYNSYSKPVIKKF
jgi:hypothetical protein